MIFVSIGGLLMDDGVTLFVVIRVVFQGDFLWVRKIVKGDPGECRKKDIFIDVWFVLFSSSVL